jgi:nucleoside 2-deoxyribosyltransferase
MQVERGLKCVISGSFDKSKPEIDLAIEEFTDLGVKVLAPDKGWLIVPQSKRKLPFRPLKSEIHMTIREIEDAFLKGIENSDFLYLVDLHGYVGESAAFEMGYAFAREIPIFAREEISQFLEDAQDLEVLGIQVATPEQVVARFKEDSSNSS